MIRWLLTLVAILLLSVSSGQTLIKKADLLRKQIAGLPEDTVLANRIILLAQTEFYIGLRDSAILHSKQSESLSRSLDYLPGIVESKLNLITTGMEMRNYALADSEWRKAIALIPRISDKQDRNYYEVSLYCIRAIYWVRKLKVDSAVHYLRVASENLPHQIRDKRYEHVRVVILNATAFSLSLRSMDDSAATVFLSALAYAEKVKDTIGMAQVNYQFANKLYSFLFGDAIKPALDCVNLAAGQGMMTIYSQGLALLADIYYLLNKTDSASQFFIKAIAGIREHSRDSAELSYVLSRYSELLISVDSLDKAEKVISEAWAICDQEKFSYSGYMLLTQYCNILHLQKKYNEEWRFIQATEKLLGNHFIPKCTGALYGFKIDYYKATGNYQAAFDEIEKRDALLDTVRNQQQELAIVELNTKYETEKKDKEIIKLNAEQQIAAARISRQRILVFMLVGFSLLLAVAGFSVYKRIQLKRKTELEIARLEQVNQIQNIRNRISRDMHDDIGASLSKMGMLAQQAKLQIQKGKAEDSIGTFDKITNQSKEVVSGLSTIIWAINPQYDNLKSMLGFMRNYISDFFEGNVIEYSIDFPDVDESITIHPELKRNLFLVLKESLNNIVKHSRATDVKIRFVTGDGKYQFEIIDNGTGVDASKDKSFSNGLISMKKRMEEIKGLFHLNTDSGRGTSIELEGVLF